ncbi:MAG: hypothetical protein HY737_08050 [Candidatus Omnitrophica bacterium]|nr:hypothetical protein [Candidatus Omnitrophota bacterium]
MMWDMRCKKTLVGVAAGALLACASAEAAGSMAISAVRGGSTAINLGELDSVRRTTYEEVTIQLSTSPAAQFQLFSLVSAPLINERGITLDPALLTIEISGGNSGTVRVRTITPLPSGTAELFTSSATGEAETLRILFGCSPQTLPAAGSYVGAMTFSLVSVEGSSPIVIQTIPIRVTVYPVMSLALDTDSATRLRFRGDEQGTLIVSQPVRLLISSNAPGPIELVHIIEGSLLNEEGRSLPLSVLTLRIAEEGTPPKEIPVSTRMTLLTSESALAVRRVELAYRAVVPVEQRGGVYRGVVNLQLAAAAGGVAAERTSVQLPVELDVPSMLRLTILSAESDRLELAFSKLLPGETSLPKTFSFTVQANTGQPYGVFQELAYLLVSDEGRQLPQEAFTCAGTAEAGSGTLRITQETSVLVGKSLVYQSDPSGAPAAFSVTCRVHVPKDASGGLYRASLRYTITPL